MNERIRELYLQAVEYSNGQMTFGDTREFFAEKFAELIVQECFAQIEIVKQDFRNDEVPEHGQYNYKQITGAEYCKLKIAEHFGVEE